MAFVTFYYNKKHSFTLIWFKCDKIVLEMNHFNCLHRVAINKNINFYIPYFLNSSILLLLGIHYCLQVKEKVIYKH